MPCPLSALLFWPRRVTHDFWGLFSLPTASWTLGFSYLPGPANLSWESLRQLLQLVTKIPEDMLSKLHMCTTHTHTDTPGSHSPLLSPSRLSGPGAGLLRQLPSLSTKDGRSQPLCSELAFCMPLILRRGSRWHRTALFLSEILRRVHSGTPNLVMEFASATKGV